MLEYPAVLWDTRVRPPHPPGRACRVRNVKCRPQSTYLGTLSVGVFLYAANTAEAGRLVFARVPTGPVGPTHATAAPTEACQSCAECQMSAAVDIFGHIIGGRFLYAAARAKEGCLLLARVPISPVGHAHGPPHTPGRACRVRNVKCRPQSTYLGTLSVYVFCTRPPRPKKGALYLRKYPPVLWDTRVRPPRAPGRACCVRNVKCRPQSTYLGTLSVGVFCTWLPRPR